MALGTGYQMDDCAVARTLDVIGERWTLLIVAYLFFGLRRYTDIRKRLGVSPAVLTERLTGLVEEGVVARVPGPGAHDEYELTEKGASLWPVVSGIVQWGNANFLPPEQRHDFVHAACGTSLDATGWCASCGIVPDAAGVDRMPRADRPDEPHRLLQPLRAVSAA